MDSSLFWLDFEGNFHCLMQVHVIGVCRQDENALSLACKLTASGSTITFENMEGVCGNKQLVVVSLHLKTWKGCVCVQTNSLW